MASNIQILENRLKAIETGLGRMGARIDGLGFTIGMISDGPVRASLGIMNSGMLGGAGYLGGLAAATTLMYVNKYVENSVQASEINNQSADANRLRDLRSASGLFKSEADLTTLSLEAARDRMNTNQASNKALQASTNFELTMDRLGLSNNQAQKALALKKAIVSKRDILRFMGRTEEQIDRELAADDKASITSQDINKASREYFERNWYSRTVGEVSRHVNTNEQDRIDATKAMIQVQNPDMSVADVNAFWDGLCREQQAFRQLQERESAMKMVDRQNKEGASRAAKTLVGMKETLDTRKSDFVDRMFHVRIEPQHRD